MLNEERDGVAGGERNKIRGREGQHQERVAIGEHMVATSALKIVKMCPPQKKKRRKTENRVKMCVWGYTQLTAG